MEIRAETPEDFAAVRAVNMAAFARDSEADLVDRLRQAAPTLSFVAVQAGQVVGHLLFSSVTVAGEGRRCPAMLGLAPLAVLPAHQRQGIGSAIVAHGLADCAAAGYGAVVVLGDPTFYSRFGFAPAQNWGLSCEYDVPAEAFQVLELQNGALQACRGIVQYRSEFASV